MRFEDSEQMIAAILGLSAFIIIGLLRVRNCYPETRYEVFLEDKDLVSVDLTTGMINWRALSGKLGIYDFTIRDDRIVVSLDNNRTVHVDPDNGNELPVTDGTAMLIKGRTRSRRGDPLALDNGWTINREATRDKVIQFFKDGSPVWKLVLPWYPYKSASNGDRFVVFPGIWEWTMRDVISCYSMASKMHLWTVRIGKYLRCSEDDLPCVTSALVWQDNVLALGGQYLFCLSMDYGKLNWYVDLASDNQRAFPADFSGAGTIETDLLLCEPHLVIIFEKCILALDIAAQRYRWVMHPDTSPMLTTGIASKGRLYVIAGRARTVQSLSGTKIRRNQGSKNLVAIVTWLVVSAASIGIIVVVVLQVRKWRGQRRLFLL